MIKVVNTIESFKELDKKAFIDSIGAEICAAIDNGGALDDPSVLTRWAMLVFSNLKTYSHIYWFAFPAISPQPPSLAFPAKPLASHLSASQQADLHKAYKAATERYTFSIPPSAAFTCFSQDISTHFQPVKFGYLPFSVPFFNVRGSGTYATIETFDLLLSAKFSQDFSSHSRPAKFRLLTPFRKQRTKGLCAVFGNSAPKDRHISIT
jgi:hypothetical protein